MSQCLCHLPHFNSVAIVLSDTRIKVKEGAGGKRGEMTQTLYEKKKKNKGKYSTIRYFE
jgi:hypothetical protein